MSHTYKLKCIMKRPNEQYGHVTHVSDTLENLQKNVGGYIEVVSIVPQVINDDGDCIAHGLAVICDEEGRIKGKPYNCDICGISFVGDIIVIGTNGDEFCDIPIDFKTFKELIA